MAAREQEVIVSENQPLQNLNIIFGALKLFNKVPPIPFYDVIMIIGMRTQAILSPENLGEIFNKFYSEQLPLHPPLKNDSEDLKSVHEETKGNEEAVDALFKEAILTTYQKDGFQFYERILMLYRSLSTDKQFLADWVLVHGSHDPKATTELASAAPAHKQETQRLLRQKSKQVTPPKQQKETEFDIFLRLFSEQLAKLYEMVPAECDVALLALGPNISPMTTLSDDLIHKGVTIKDAETKRQLEEASTRVNQMIQNFCRTKLLAPAASKSPSTGKEEPSKGGLSAWIPGIPGILKKVPRPSLSLSFLKRGETPASPSEATIVAENLKVEPVPTVEPVAAVIATPTVVEPTTAVVAEVKAAADAEPVPSPLAPVVEVPPVPAAQQAGWTLPSFPSLPWPSLPTVDAQSLEKTLGWLMPASLRGGVVNAPTIPAVVHADAAQTEGAAASREKPKIE